MSDPTFRDALPETCDFLVIGAGPAGLVAAYTLVTQKAGTVVLIDRRDPWREPVACGEGVHLVPFRKASPLAVEPWIRQYIDRCKLATPEVFFVWQSPGDGAIIDRAKMQSDFSHEIAKLGALCHFRCRAVEVSKLAEGFRTVRCEGEFEGTLKARCVIDASGPGSSFGKDEGLTPPVSDVEPAVFALVEGLEYDPGAIEMWYSTTFAPGGYAWLFPGGNGKANVGVVCGRGSGLPPREGLRRFLSHLKPGLEPQAVHGGAIPCGSGAGPLARDLLFKAGDAAAMVHPLDRSGIVEAFDAGRMAAQNAMAALAEPDERRREIHYHRYRKSWRSAWGRFYSMVAWLKPLMRRMDDDVWTSMFRSLSKVPMGKHRWRHAVLSAMGISPKILRCLISAR
jgi:digeranylgeranylglycerophospholipid reductase